MTCGFLEVNAILEKFIASFFWASLPFLSELETEDDAADKKVWVRSTLAILVENFTGDIFPIWKLSGKILNWILVEKLKNASFYVLNWKKKMARIWSQVNFEKGSTVDITFQIFSSFPSLIAYSL